MGHSKKKNKNLILDQFHYHEAIERIYLLGNIGEMFIDGHPVFKKHKKIKKKIKKALKIIADIYQELSRKEFKIFDKEKTADTQ
jgi:hypothetical protein